MRIPRGHLGREPYLFEQVGDVLPALAVVVQNMVYLHGFNQGFAHAQHGIERGKRILEDDLDLTPEISDLL